MVEIRPAVVADLPSLYRVALRTGDGGEDATGLHLDPDLLGHVFVGPYVALGEGVGFTAVDEAGVAGYVLGTANTTAFFGEAEQAWFPALRSRYDIVDRDRLTSADLEVLRLVYEPPLPPADVVEDFPSHLHIDFEERLRGRGVGRRMIDALLAELVKGGATAVSLGVDENNSRAIGFYQHLGFRRLCQVDDEVFMGLELGR